MQAISSRRIVMAIICQGIALLALILASCAGTPPSRAVKIETAVREAEKLLEIASPESLAEGIAILSARDLQDVPEAGELKSRAGAIFLFLYPELEQYLKEKPAYSGPYEEVLAAAGEGRAQEIGPESLENASFFDLVLPSFYLLKAIEPEAEKQSGPADDRLKELLITAEKMNRDSVLPPFFRGIIAEQEKDFEQAAGFYSESAARTDSFYPGFYRLALAALELGKQAEAILNLEKSLKIVPGYYPALTALAEIYLLNGELDKAEALAANMLLMNLEDEKALLLRTKILLKGGNWPQALKPLNLVLLKNPEATEAHLLKARILYESAKVAGAALKLLKEAEENFPDDPRFPELIGTILMETGKSAEGLRELNRALELAPTRISVLRLLLENAVQMKRWLQAVVYLDGILAQEEREDDLRQAYRVYSSLGDSSQALYYAEKIYQSGKSLYSSPIYARALFQNQDRDKALALIEQSLKEVSDPAVRSELLLLKAQGTIKKDPETALRHLQAALLENPDNQEALLLISDLYVNSQEYRKARLFLKRAVDLDPDNPGLIIRLRQVEAVLESAVKENES